MRRKQRNIGSLVRKLKKYIKKYKEIINWRKVEIKIYRKDVKSISRLLMI